MSALQPWEEQSSQMGFFEQRRWDREQKSQELELRRTGKAAEKQEFLAALAAEAKRRELARLDEYKGVQMRYQAGRGHTAGVLLTGLHDEFARMSDGDPGKARLLARIQGVTNDVVIGNIK